MRTFVRVAASAVLLGLLLWRVGTRDVLAPLWRAQPGTLAAAFAIYCASQALSALRWMRLAEGVGFRAPFGRYLRVYFIGMFFGIVVPSTLGADASRALYLGRRPPGRAFALSSVLADRVVGLVALVLVAVVAIVFGPSASLPPELTWAVGGIGTALVAGWLALPRLVRLLPAGRRLRRLVEQDLLPYFRDPGLLGVATGLSVVIHLAQIASQDLLVDAIHLKVPYSFVAIYHPLVSLAAAIPLTIGGFGLREAAYALLLPLAGIPTDDAVALGLLWWAIGAAGGLVGGVIYALSPVERIELRRTERRGDPGA